MSCGYGGTCHNIDDGGGFYCECPLSVEGSTICSNCTCDHLPQEPQSVLQIGTRAIAAIVMAFALMSCTHPN